MRWPAIAVVVTAGTVDPLYLRYVSMQGADDPQFQRVPFVASFVALMAICAALSIPSWSARWRPLLLGVSAGGLLLLGYFAMFSIGLPLMVGGLLALYGLSRSLAREAGGEKSGRRLGAGMAVGGAALGTIVLLAGFSVTELAIKCPATGAEGGGGTSFLGGSYQYSCENGKLTITR